MKRSLLLTLLLLGFTEIATGRSIDVRNILPSDPVQVKSIKSVYDGDTFRAYLPNFQKDQRIRVRGVDTPEIKGKCQFEKELAIKAREFTKSFLKLGAVELKNLSKDRYQRILADVFVNGRGLDKALIERGLGRKWRGKRENWCK